jgi:NAD(P)-dependent dehydrogenase (short-subunit alcohol dehydrogenase family)
MPEIVVITGASAGAGRATAIEFARQGASAVVLLPLFRLTENRDALTTAAGALLTAFGLVGLRRERRPD